MPERCGHACQEDLAVSPITAEEAFISATISLPRSPENEGPGMTGQCFNIMGNGCGLQPVLHNPKERDPSVNKHRGPQEEICEAHTDLQSLAMEVRGGQTACGGGEMMTVMLEL